MLNDYVSCRFVVILGLTGPNDPQQGIQTGANVNKNHRVRVKGRENIGQFPFEHKLPHV